MFNLFHRSQPQQQGIRQALLKAGVAGADDPTRIVVLEKRGNYSGRRVKYFSAFEPGHQDAILGSGHVEDGGAVVVNVTATARTSSIAAPVRQPADRAEHTDDHGLVFWDPDKTTSNAVLPSSAATPLAVPSHPGEQR